MEDSDTISDESDEENQAEEGNGPDKFFLIKAFGFYALAILISFLLAGAGMELFPNTYGDAGSLYRIFVTIQTILTIIAVPYATAVVALFFYLRKRNQSLYQRWGKKTVYIVTGAAVLVCLFFTGLLAVDPVTCPHVALAEATCTEPQTCESCGKRFGEPLGHDWQEATCTKPKTCKRCGQTEGNKAPHTGGQWSVVQEATCTEAGSEETKCTVCGEKMTRSIGIIDHTPGEMETTQEASVDFSTGQRVVTKGKREQKCTVCGTVLKTEEFDPTDQQNMDAFKAVCSGFSYNDVARNPDQFDGTFATFTGKVIQVMETGGAYTLRVNKDSDYGSTMYVIYIAPEGSPKILEDDVMTFWGELSGSKTYQSIFGQSITIPSFTAMYAG